MKKVQSLWFLSALALFLSVGISLNAQTTTPQPSAPDAQSQPSTPPDSQSQPTATPEQSQPSQTPSQPPDQANRPAPDSQTPSAQPTDAQSFSGTIVKTGDKYVLQDDASGKAYDIDHQAEVQKYEGKKVKVHGTLDASGKMIHIQ
jgi:hypothetical protein